MVEARGGIRFTCYSTSRWASISRSGGQLEITKDRRGARLELARGRGYQFEIVDDGKNVSFRFWDPADPQHAARATDTVLRHTSESNQIIFYCRELQPPDRTYKVLLDDVVIETGVGSVRCAAGVLPQRRSAERAVLPRPSFPDGLSRDILLRGLMGESATDGPTQSSAERNRREEQVMLSRVCRVWLMGGAGALLLSSLPVAGLRAAQARQAPAAAEIAAERAEVERPNILWITCEDMDPNLGCFGDIQAVTPNLDALAARSVRYTRAFATAPACSPARSCLITGVWPGTMGTPHLRNRTVKIPSFIKPYPMYLREAGYYCVNPGKQDYNFAKPPGIWDDESPRGHWRGRKPGQPFFAVFNIITTHQGQFRQIDMSAQTRQLLAALPPVARHDAAGIKLPPFYPDTPVVRRDVATHYDCISAMDAQVGEILRQIEKDGLADETIIFFYSDHGRGMPRGKRWLYDGGLHVPLIVCFPPKWRHLATGRPGSISDRLVSFIDFPPTLLSLAGVKIPRHMEGVAFAGPQAGQPRRYIHAARDRVDEVIDRSRCVRDARYKYIRHYLPHRPMMQFSWYSERTPTRGELRRLAAEGKLFGHEKTLMQPTRPIEELYDTAADPYELYNLADDSEYAPVLARMRRELRRWLAASPDATLLPEGMMHARATKHGVTVYEMARDPELYPVKRIIEAAERVGCPEVSTAELVGYLRDADPGVRYWAAVALAVKGPEAAPAAEALGKCLADEWPDVRIAAAEALCRLGRPDEAVKVLADALGHEDYWVRIHAAAVLHELGETARPALPAMKKAAAQQAPWPYLGWGLGRTIGRLEK